MKNTAALVFFLFLVYCASYIVYFAPPEIHKRLAQLQVDKLFHFAAGLLLAALFSVGLRWQNRMAVFVAVAAVAVGWEALELFVDPWTFEASAMPHFSTLTDTLGDIAATLIGAATYFGFLA